MLRRFILALTLGLLAASPAAALTIAVKQALGPPGWVLPYNPDLQFDFARGTAWKGTGTGGGAVVPASSLLTVTRASNATDLLPTSAAGFPYATFTSNQLARTPNLGLLGFGARTNLLLNSTAPVTQTTGSLANGTYTLWVNGSGSATMSAGTATGCGTDVATQGVPVNFTTTGAAGTCVVTVAGSLNAFQLELGDFGSSLIVTAGVTAARAADVAIAINSLPFGSAYTLFGEGTPFQPDLTVGTQTVLRIDDGTSLNDRFVIYRKATDSLASAFYNISGVSQTLTTTLWGVNTAGKIAAYAQAGEQAVSFNSGSVVTAAGLTALTAPSRIVVGSRGVANDAWNGRIKTAAVWLTRVVPQEVLRDFTRP